MKNDDAIMLGAIICILSVLCYSFYLLGRETPLNTEKYFIEQCLHHSLPNSSYASRAKECHTAYQLYKPKG